MFNEIREKCASKFIVFESVKSSSNSKYSDLLNAKIGSLEKSSKVFNWSDRSGMVTSLPILGDITMGLVEHPNGV